MFNKTKTAGWLAVVALLATGATANFATAAPSTSAANRLCADMSANNVVMQIMGDSIMTHAGASEEARGWPKQFQDYMATKSWTVFTDKARAGSKAVDFTATGQYASVTSQVRQSNPTLVTLNWRTNEQ